MKLGISVGNFSWPAPVDQIGPTVGRLARAADEGGIDSFWTMDHFFRSRRRAIHPRRPFPRVTQRWRSSLARLSTSVSARS